MQTQVDKKAAVLDVKKLVPVIGRYFSHSPYQMN
jgi:hypothetical protein